MLMTDAEGAQQYDVNNEGMGRKELVASVEPHSNQAIHAHSTLHKGGMSRPLAKATQETTLRMQLAYNR